MPGYHERLRDLDHTRWLMRDFLIHGFRARNEQHLGSARTYDNERHRIESLLGDTLRWRQGEGGREYFIAAEAAALSANPLHRIYRLRTFTDRDLMLHCCLLALLDREKGMSADEVTDAIALRTEYYADVQAVRRKLQEYTALGIVREERDGKRKVYALEGAAWDAALPDDTGMDACLAFFREALPLGSLADGMMLRRGYGNRFIRFKHHFLMHTLDDDVLLGLLEAMQAGEAVRVSAESQAASCEVYQAQLVPAVVRVSEETGRRYLIGYDMERQAARALRLDLIRGVERIGPPEDRQACLDRVREALEHCWGIALPEGEEAHRVVMDVRIRLPEEAYVLDRLRREGRGGSVTRIDWDLFRYEIQVTDTMEMMRWIRTFTGRIVALRDDSGRVDGRFREDMARLRAMYGVEVKE
ncbi:MAG: WYL domain-containing protein [Aristaeellaceae bacterium]